MNSTPRWFRVVAVLALLWNVAGLIAFLSDASMGPDDVAKLTADQQALYAARPAWALWSTAVATVGGTLGSLALLLRRRWAFPILVLSVVGLVGQDLGFMQLPGGISAIGAVPMVLQTVVLAVSIGLVLLARKAIARGWLA